MLYDLASQRPAVRIPVDMIRSPAFLVMIRTAPDAATMLFAIIEQAALTSRADTGGRFKITRGGLIPDGLNGDRFDTALDIIDTLGFAEITFRDGDDGIATIAPAWLPFDGFPPTHAYAALDQSEARSVIRACEPTSAEIRQFAQGG